MTGDTLVEKIIKSRTTGPKEEVFPGNIVWVKLDLVTARDFAGPQVINLFDSNYPDSKPFDKTKVVFTPDCYPYGNDPKHAADQEILRVFVREHDLTITDLGSGIGSHLIVRRGMVFPGDIVIGTDSHYNLLGAVGVLGQGAGDVMVAYSLKTGEYWIMVPETVKVTITGSYSYPTTAKDLALYVLLKLHERGVTGKAVEFCGDTVANLSVEERLTLCSLVTEASGAIGFVAPDEKTAEYYRKHTGKAIDMISADPDATYSDEFTIDVQDLGVHVACPPHPHNVKPIEEVLGTPISSVIVGSCTNGTSLDIQMAAKVVEGKKVDPNVRFGVIPATREDVVELAHDGTYVTLLDAGANFFGAGCSTCAKGQYGLTGGETSPTMTTGNRNTQGKIGPAPVYLASPVVAAATALKGKIALPED